MQGELIDEQKKCDEDDEHQFYVKVVTVYWRSVCVTTIL